MNLIIRKQSLHFNLNLLKEGTNFDDFDLNSQWNFTQILNV